MTALRPSTRIADINPYPTHRRPDRVSVRAALRGAGDPLRRGCAERLLPKGASFTLTPPLDTRNPAEKS